MHKRSIDDTRAIIYPKTPFLAAAYAYKIFQYGV
jgi:hypothetical protein